MHMRRVFVFYLQWPFLVLPGSPPILLFKGISPPHHQLYADHPTVRSLLPFKGISPTPTKLMQITLLSTHSCFLAASHTSSQPTSCKSSLSTRCPLLCPPSFPPLSPQFSGTRQVQLREGFDLTRDCLKKAATAELFGGHQHRPSYSHPAVLVRGKGQQLKWQGDPLLSESLLSVCQWYPCVLHF